MVLLTALWLKSTLNNGIMDHILISLHLNTKLLCITNWYYYNHTNNISISPTECTALLHEGILHHMLIILHSHIKLLLTSYDYITLLDKGIPDHIIIIYIYIYIYIYIALLRKIILDHKLILLHPHTKFPRLVDTVKACFEIIFVIPTTETEWWLNAHNFSLMTLQCIRLFHSGHFNNGSKWTSYWDIFFNKHYTQQISFNKMKCCTEGSNEEENNHNT